MSAVRAAGVVALDVAMPEVRALSTPDRSVASASDSPNSGMAVPVAGRSAAAVSTVEAHWVSCCNTGSAPLGTAAVVTSVVGSTTAAVIALASEMDGLPGLAKLYVVVIGVVVPPWALVTVAVTAIPPLAVGVCSAAFGLVASVVRLTPPFSANEKVAGLVGSTVPLVSAPVCTLPSFTVTRVKPSAAAATMAAALPSNDRPSTLFTGSATVVMRSLSVKDGS